MLREILMGDHWQAAITLRYPWIQPKLKKSFEKTYRGGFTLFKLLEKLDFHDRGQGVLNGALFF